MREPPFWWRPAGLEAKLLAPAAAIYGAVAARRLKVLADLDAFRQRLDGRADTSRPSRELKNE